MTGLEPATSGSHVKSSKHLTTPLHLRVDLFMLTKDCLRIIHIRHAAFMYVIVCVRRNIMSVRLLVLKSTCHPGKLPSILRAVFKLFILHGSFVMQGFVPVLSYFATLTIISFFYFFCSIGIVCDQS